MSFILVVFHFDRCSFWLSSILVVFFFGLLPFWSHIFCLCCIMLCVEQNQHRVCGGVGVCFYHSALSLVELSWTEFELINLT